MKRRIGTLFIVLMLLVAATGTAQVLKKKKDPPPPPDPPPPVEVRPRIKLTAENLFFTEPYIYLNPPVNNRLAMCMDLDYAFIRYPFGFVNTLDMKGPLVEFRKRIRVTEQDQLDKITRQTGFQQGDRVTVVSALGKAYPARIESFSYVGNSPSTVIVAADLIIEADETDPTLFSKHGVALRGMHEMPTTRQYYVDKSLASSEPLRQKLLRLCSASLPDGHIVEDVKVAPAFITPDLARYYFVSYWERPEENFEIEEVLLKSCLFKPVGEGWAKADMPLPMQVEQVFDLDQDGKAEIYAMAGDGTEVCFLYLAPKGDSYSLLKKGLCAGY